MSDTSQPKTETNTVKDAKPAETKDQSPLNLALQTLGGDNKLLGNLFKTLLSPIGALLAMCGAGYLFYKNQEYKKVNEKLEAENAALKEKNEELVEKYLRAKRRKIEDYEERQNEQLSGGRTHRLEKKNKKTIYLD